MKFFPMIVLVAFLSALASTSAFAVVSEDFESIDSTVGETIRIGNELELELALFSGDAFSGVAGIPELYRSGSHAWMVNPGGTGSIQFIENAASVEFWTRLRSSANGSTEYTALDDLGQVIDSVVITDPQQGFQLLRFTGSIDRINVVNNATGAGQMNSIDDFTFTSVPEPSAIMVMLASAALLAGQRRGRARQGRLDSQDKPA